MSVKVTVQPSREPVSLELVKKHIVVENDDDDAYIETLIAAARAHLEDETKRSFVSKTIEATFRRFPQCGPLIVPCPPLVSVDSVSYLDANGEEKTLEQEKYLVRAASGRIAVKPGELWPETYDVPDAVTVTCIVGYGEPDKDGNWPEFPDALRQAMMLLIGHWDENREAVNIGNITTALPLSVQDLIAPHCIKRFF